MDIGRGPWPSSASRDDAGVLHVGGIATTELAARFGTPLWVVDEDDVRERCRAYRAGFPGVDVAYASKAWCTVALLQIVDDEGLMVDVASAGELHTALIAGVAPDRLVMHGNNKSTAELDRALEVGVGRIVLDSFEEIVRLEALAREQGVRAPCHLRVTPGIDAHTHEYVRTGHDDSKFGFTLSSGLAERAILEVSAADHLDLLGLHAHIGSQIFGTDPFIANAEVMVDLIAHMRDEHQVPLAELNLGGGMGIRYTHEDHPVEIARYGAALLEAVDERCARHGLARPRLLIEPGRALVGPSTVTLYTVGTVKALPGLTTWVSVDGGMSDNIRPALYGAEHEVALANRAGSGELRSVSIVGKHCESGDVVREHVPLPVDLGAGDLVAVAATGAYTEAMASNYNRLPRPAAVLVRNGRAVEMIRRETLDDLVRRDVGLR